MLYCITLRMCPHGKYNLNRYNYLWHPCLCFVEITSNFGPHLRIVTGEGESNSFLGGKLFYIYTQLLIHPFSFH